MLNIGIIVGSTRPGRRGSVVAQWVHRIAEEHLAASGPDGAGVPDVAVEVVDLAEVALPLLDEAVPGIFGDYEHAHTQRWAQTVGSFDGFVFVTPEYNHSVPAPLKNALDYLFAEWNDKAAGFVGYGLTGGTRAVEHLRLVMGELKVADVRTQVELSLFTDFALEDPKETGRFTPGDHQGPTLCQMLDELVSWAQALQRVRETAGAGVGR